MYTEHVLLHSLVLPLLDLIQSPYHGIIVALVTKCLLHVHQQVPHGDILALIQRAGPFAGVPTETGKDGGAHAGLIILLKKCVHIKVPECVHHLGSWISRLKDWHIQSHWCQLFPLPTPSAAPAPTPAACSQVSIRVQCPSGEEGGEPPPPTVVHWDFGGLPCSCAAPVWVVSLALVTSSTPVALLTCCGALPTSWLEESDPLAATTGILWTGFSAQPLSLQRSEAETDHHHASIRGRRLMAKWAEHEIHSEKASSTWVWTACTASCPKPRRPCLS